MSGMSGMSEPVAASAQAIERLCASMRVLAAGGPQHPDLEPAVSACIEAFAGVAPPVALRFVAGTTLRTCLPLIKRMCEPKGSSAA
jgi:hypothetical protein